MIAASTFGASAPAGGCPVHPTQRATPSSTVRRLQQALRGLSLKVNDAALVITPDGLIGPKTVSATNRAMTKYALSAPAKYRTGSLTKGQVVASAAQLAAFVEKAPSQPVGNDGTMEPSFVTAANAQAAAYAAAGRAAGAASAAAGPGSGPVTRAPVPAVPGVTAPAGGSSMSYPPTPPFVGRPTGYSPGYAPGYAPRGPGGLPTDQATLDVKAFIPAQYQHVTIHPGTVIAVLALAGGIAYVMVKRRENKK